MKRTKQKLFFSFLILIVCQLTYSQATFNLGFEEYYPRTKIVTQWKTGYDNGVYSMDNTIKYSGKRSFKIMSLSNDRARTAYIEIAQLLNKYINTTIRIEAKIKFDTTQVVKPDLALYINQKGKDTTLNSKITDVKIKSDWQTTSLDFNLDTKQANAYLLVRNNDKGNAWFDDIKIFSNGAEVAYFKELPDIKIDKASIHPITSKNKDSFTFPQFFIDKLNSKK